MISQILLVTIPAIVVAITAILVIRQMLKKDLEAKKIQIILENRRR